MRSELLAEVAAMRQSHTQSVKGYIAVGREYLIRLREVGVEKPATLLIPTPYKIAFLIQKHVCADVSH